MTENTNSRERAGDIPAYAGLVPSGLASEHGRIQDARLNDSKVRNILWEVQQRRFLDFSWNLGFFAAIAFFALVVGYAVTSLLGFYLHEETPTLAGFVMTLCVPLGMLFVLLVIAVHACILFFPLVFLFWGNIKKARQRKLLSLILASMETQAPLGPILRAHAHTSYSPMYRGNLIAFADALDRGFTIQQALKHIPGMVRYDLAAILEINSTDKETYETLQQVLDNEQELSSSQTDTSLRFVYLMVVSVFLMKIMGFQTWFVLPSFKMIFEEMGTRLPFLTELVALFMPTLSILMFFGFILMIIFIGVYFLMLTGIISSRPFGMRWLFRWVDSARLLRVLAAGLRRQRTIPESLGVYYRSLRSAFLSRQTQRMEQRIESGQAWIPTLRRESLISAADARILEAAQRAGNLPDMLEDISMTNDRNQLLHSDFVSQLFFFPCILLVSAFVGAFVIAYFLPMVQLIMQMAV